MKINKYLVLELPFNAFQIYLSDKGNDTSLDLPSLLREASANFKRSLPNDHIYTLYNKETLAEFIKSNFDKEVFKAYEKLKPYSYKADLGKYCIAYKYGGWYSDMTLKIISQLPPMDSDCELICFRDLGAGFNMKALNYGMQASLFYAKRNNKVFQKAIDYILENCRTENYGKTPVCPTGPGVFGRAYAYCGAQSNHVVGSYVPLTPNLPIKNRAYLVPTGQIFALHKDAWNFGSEPGDLSKFGTKGTNNYVSMYFSKDIYETSG